MKIIIIIIKRTRKKKREKKKIVGEMIVLSYEFGSFRGPGRN